MNERRLRLSLRLCVLPLLAVLVGCGANKAGTEDKVSTSVGQALITPNHTITQGADEQRTSWFPDQPTLDPSVVGDSTTFGPIFSVPLPGGTNDQVVAQPLVNGNSVFIATEANNLYTLNAATGAIMSQRSLGPSFDPSVLGCADLTPGIGITGTPVIDTNTNTAYLFSKTQDASKVASWSFHAVDANTLADKWTVAVQGAASNDASVPFKPQLEHQRPGLLLLNGIVYGGFGGHCDAGNYSGWLIGISTTTHAITTMFVTEPATTYSGGIWQSGGGIMSDGANRIWFLTGNGALGNPGTPIAGSAPPKTLGNALVQMQVQADNSLKPVQFFAPYHITGDDDFASGAPVALPSFFGAGTAHTSLAVASGKQGHLYVVDRNALGGYQQSAAVDNFSNPPLVPANQHLDLVVSQTQLQGGTWSKPAAWPGDGGWLYVTAGGGTPFEALQYGTPGGVPTFTNVGNSADNLGGLSGSPVVTSNGTTAGSALVWVTGQAFQAGIFGAQLRAYDAVPVGGVLTLRYASPSYSATHVKFTNPGVGAGRVYVGGFGTVMGFGSSLSGPVAGSLTDLGTVVLTRTVTRNVTFTATAAATVNSLTSSNAAFTLGTPSRALPAALSVGDTFTVPVTFSPTSVQAYAAHVNAIATDGTSLGAVPMKGLGQANGPWLSMGPAKVDFHGVQTGTTATATVQVTNIGSQVLTVTGSVAPAAPVTASALPATLAANGGTANITLTYAPTVNGTYNSSYTVNTNAQNGNGTTTLVGTAGSAPVLSITPLNSNFGDVPIGANAALSFTVRNTGGSDLKITRSKPPILNRFAAVAPYLQESTTIAAGQSSVQTVNFNPAVPGTFNDTWSLNSNDTVTGLQTVNFTGTSGQTARLARTGWVATGSPSSATDVAANALDGNAGSRFSSGTPQAAGQTFTVDMGAPLAFTQVTYDAGNGSGDYPHTYKLEASANNTAWTTLVANGVGAGSLLNIPVGAQTARYLRLTLLGSSPNWLSVTEFNVSNVTAAHNPLPRGNWAVSAFATGGADVATNVLDNNGATRWSSGVAEANSPQTFVVNLQTAQTFNRIDIDAAGNAGDYAHGYGIDVSNDGANWTQVASGVGSTQLISVTFPAQTAKFMRINQTGTATGWWSIAELNLYNSNVALSRTGWVGSAFATAGTDVAANAFDNNNATRWSSGVAMSDGTQWFKVNLGSAQTFTQILIDAANNNGDYPAGWAVYVSNDNVSWGQPIASGVGSTQLITVTVPNTTAQYVRINQTGTANAWWSIAELNILQ